QRFVNELLLLDFVPRVQAGGGRGGFLAAGIHRTLATDLLDAAVHERPGAHVARLLLAPDYALDIGLARDLRRQRLGRERIQLLDPDDGRIPSLVARGYQIVIHLAAA